MVTANLPLTTGAIKERGNAQGSGLEEEEKCSFVWNIGERQRKMNAGLKNYQVITIPFVAGADLGFSLEHPQGVGIVRIVGTIGIVEIVGIEFCRTKPRPTTPSILVEVIQT